MLRHRRRPRIESLENRICLAASFAAPVTSAASDGLRGIAAGDFNGDGKQDVAVASTSGGGTVLVLTGKGDGTFNAPTTIAATGNASGVTAADLNKDGK